MTSTTSRRTVNAVAVTGLIASALFTRGLADAPTHHQTTVAAVTAAAQPATPRPPVLPANFQGRGRYIVADLGINVPFSWQGRDGDSQMIAGGPQYRIWFTNVIYRNSLYTLTYKWPRLRSGPFQQCDRVGFFNRRMFNHILKTSRFVGPEILQGTPNRYVDHWRVGVVAGSKLPGKEFRVPIALGDIYTGQQDPSQWWQVLQYGLQNIYDPQLDEWFTMTSFTHQPGQVKLPARCR